MTIRIVLCQTSHSGNIGATARAMKNMGLSDLVLVAPKHFPSAHASARASGADDVLTSATIVQTLEEAIAPCHLVLGTSARIRTLPQPLINAREAAQESNKASAQNQSVAIVFGHERNGLSNHELSLCHKHIQIPCNPDFSSLNLAAAVQVITYELRMVSHQSVESEDYDTLATHEEMEGFYRHLQMTLESIEFLDSKFPKKIMPKIRRLFNRAMPEATEMNILRGILTAINRKFQ